MKKPYVAIVDDDSAFANYLRTFLSLRGYETRSYSRGDEMLAAVKQGDPPDVVLLDVMMPDVDGPATLERLRPLIGDAPVIFLTAKTQSSDLERLTSLGAVGVIAKPFDPMALPAEVDGLIGGAG